MSRSKWKGSFLDNLLYSAILKKAKIPNFILRRENLIKDFENIVTGVPNGKAKIPFLINKQMLGFRAGDFVLTRKFRLATKKKKR